MIKLEKMLFNLGYDIDDQNWEHPKWFHKIINDIKIGICVKDLSKSYVHPINLCFRNLQYIDNLQQAFNILQKDLEVLKVCRVLIARY